MNEVTQEQLDEMFLEIKQDWDQKVLESGRSEAMFIVMDNTGYVAHFMNNYSYVKEEVEKQGLIMPELVKGLEVNYEDD